MISRKALRKEKRHEKKQKKEIYYKKLYEKPENQEESLTKPEKKEKVLIQSKKIIKINEKMEKSKKSKEIKENEEDVLIKKYEKKLGISQDKKKEAKFQRDMSKDGLDGDFFSLLDKIHESYRNPLEKYEVPEDIEENEEIDEEFEENDKPFEEENEDVEEFEGNNENNGNDDSFDENDDDLNENNEDVEDFEENEQNDEDFEENGEEIQEYQEQIAILHRKSPNPSKPILKSSKTPMISSKPSISLAKIARKAEIINQEANSELIKRLQSNLNKLAEGNIDNIFTQTLEVFNTHSKFVINELFTNLFIKHIIENSKNLPHILACTCCFTSGLHQIYDNEFFSELMRKISLILFEKLRFLSKLDEEPLQILKNISQVFSHFYLFDSLSLDFLREFINLLCENMSSFSIEILLSVLQIIGLKVRKDSPKVLKEIIDLIKDSFEREKAQNGLVSEKGDFLMGILVDIRMNKNIRNNPFESLAFLINWLKKNVIAKRKIVPKIFSFSLKAMETMDFTKAKWWSLVENASFPMKSEENDDLSQLLTSERKDYLEKLASEQKFLTTLRKKLFLVIMNAEDYIDAFQNILKMKLNRKQNQDLAVVLVECCAQESTFNKYYLFLIEKLIELRKELKFSIQYAFWDQFKLLENFTLRKICNLAKLLALLIRKKTLGLGSIKGLEFDEKNEHILLFVKAFIRGLLDDEVNRKEIGEWVEKVKRNEENLSFCEGFYEYLKKKVYIEMKDDIIKEKIKILLGFLKVDL